MLEVKCGLYKSFGPEVWIPDSRHLPSGKIALSFNQKRTLFSVWVMHVEFHHLWSAFPLNIIDQNQRKKIRKHLHWKAFRLEICAWVFFMIFLYRGGMLCTLWKAITDFREKHAWHRYFILLLCRDENISFQPEQVCCQKDCCTLIQYLFTNVKNTAASWLLLFL